MGATMMSVSAACVAVLDHNMPVRQHSPCAKGGLSSNDKIVEYIRHAAFPRYHAATPSGRPLPIAWLSCIPMTRLKRGISAGASPVIGRAAASGAAQIPMHSQSSPSYLRRLSKTACDGLIMMPGRWRTLKPLHERGVKVVEVDGDGDRLPYSRICLDDRYIGRLAGEHLLERGFTRVVYLGEGSGWSHERSGGLHQVVTDAGGNAIASSRRTGSSSHRQVGSRTIPANHPPFRGHGMQ